MLAHTYVQAFYTDWVYKLWHSTQIGHIFELSKMYPICVECLRIKKISSLCKLLGAAPFEIISKYVDFKL